MKKKGSEKRKREEEKEENQMGASEDVKVVFRWRPSEIFS